MKKQKYKETGDLGLFDELDISEKLSDMGNPLEVLNNRFDFEIFREKLESKQLEHNKKTIAGTKPFDVLLLFKILILQRYYGLNDTNVEYQILDRLSFRKFLGLRTGDKVPDETIVRAFHESLTKSRLIQELFEEFTSCLGSKGMQLHKGKIMDASLTVASSNHKIRLKNKMLRWGLNTGPWNRIPFINRIKENISELPRWGMILLLVFIIIVLCVVIISSKNISLGLWGFKLEKHPTDTVYKTISKYQADTVKIMKPITLDKSYHTNIKSADANKNILTENQTDKLNSGSDQSLSDNTKVTGRDDNAIIIQGETQRHLDNQIKTQLLKSISNTFIKNEKSKDGCIRVFAYSEREVYYLAREVLDFLKQNNYNVSNDIGQTFRTPAVQGIIIEYKNDCVLIIVGYK